jgi:hypothetical protein
MLIFLSELGVREELGRSEDLTPPVPLTHCVETVFRFGGVRS